MTKTKKQLLNIWSAVWEIPGWLALLEKTGDYDAEDIKCLEQIDEDSINIERQIISELYFKKSFKDNSEIKKTKKVKRVDFNKIKEGQSIYGDMLFDKDQKIIGTVPYIIKEIPNEQRCENEQTRIQKEINEFKEEFPESFKKERRLEYLNLKIESLEKNIKEIWKDYQEYVEKDYPFWWRSMILDLRDYALLEKHLKNLKVEKYLLENPKKFAKVDRVLPEEIDRASKFPFDQLIKFNLAGFALCPFHNESKPSLHWFKDTNIIYCFGCGYSANPIKFLRDRDKISFLKAVRSLL